MVKQLFNGLISCGRDEATTLINTLVAEGSLQPKSICWVVFTKMVLHTLNLVESVQDVHALVSGCTKAADVRGCTIVLIALGNLYSVVVLHA